MEWPTIKIQTNTGEEKAIAPYIISASRATDIPAFHGRWFMDKLQRGYCQWRNPFNTNQTTLIAFNNCKIIVFWTKNPAPFIQYLDQISSFNKKFYFQYTLNDYTKENLEPKVPPLSQRIETFIRLSEKIGKKKVIWRFDPIILSDSIGIDEILRRIEYIGNNISSYTCKLVFSFVDMYKKTENKLKKIDSSLRAPTVSEMKEIAREICLLNKQWPVKLQLATCAEEIDLSSLNISKNKCVDDELIIKICPNDNELLKLFGKAPLSGGQLTLLELPSGIKNKDSGQRSPCGCVPSKDIGAYNSCMHLCEYCYANISAKTVINNMNKLHKDSLSLV